MTRCSLQATSTAQLRRMKGLINFTRVAASGSGSRNRSCWLGWSQAGSAHRLCLGALLLLPGTRAAREQGYSTRVSKQWWWNPAVPPAAIPRAGQCFRKCFPFAWGCLRPPHCMVPGGARAARRCRVRALQTDTCRDDLISPAFPRSASSWPGFIFKAVDKDRKMFPFAKASAGQKSSVPLRSPLLTHGSGGPHTGLKHQPGPGAQSCSYWERSVLFAKVKTPEHKALF